MFQLHTVCCTIILRQARPLQRYGEHIIRGTAFSQSSKTKQSLKGDLDIDLPRRRNTLRDEPQPKRNKYEKDSKGRTRIIDTNVKDFYIKVKPKIIKDPNVKRNSHQSSTSHIEHLVERYVENTEQQLAQKPFKPAVADKFKKILTKENLNQVTYSSTSEIFDRRGAPVNESILDEIIRVHEISTREKSMTEDDWNALAKVIEDHEIWSRLNKWYIKLFAILPNLHGNPEVMLETCKSMYAYIARLEGKTGLAVQVTQILALTTFGKEMEKEKAIQIYEKLLQQYEIFPIDIAKTLAKALRQTHRWKDIFKLVDMCNHSHDGVPTVFYQGLLGAAIRAGDTDTVNNMDAILKLDGEMPDDWAVGGLLKDPTWIGDLESIFVKLENYKWIVSDKIADDIIEKINRSGRSYSLQTIGSDCKCSHCDNSLKRNVEALSKEDFKNMKDAFYQRVIGRCEKFLLIKGNDFERFETFAAEIGQVDIVIDALNIVYHKSRKKSLEATMGQTLLSTVQYFTDRNQKVLVLGRSHLQKYIAMLKVQRLAKCFFASNYSADDPLFIYAALLSGPDTKIVTRDNLRDHSYRLGQELRVVFHRWQRSHQIVPTETAMNMGNLTFKWPNPYEIAAQKTDDTWHIPVTCKDAAVEAFDFPIKWLCVTKS